MSTQIPLSALSGLPEGFAACRLLTSVEAAQLLGVPVATLRTWRSRRRGYGPRSSGRRQHPLPTSRSAVVDRPTRREPRRQHTRRNRDVAARQGPARRSPPTHPTAEALQSVSFERNRPPRPRLRPLTEANRLLPPRRRSTGRYELMARNSLQPGEIGRSAPSRSGRASGARTPPSVTDPAPKHGAASPGARRRLPAERWSTS